MVSNTFLTGTFQELIDKLGGQISSEQSIEVFYTFALEKPKPTHSLPQDEWISSIHSLSHILNEKAKQATFDIAPDPKLITLDSSTTSIDASQGAAADPTSDAFYAMQYMTSKPLNGLRGAQIIDAGRQRRRNVAGVRF